MFFNPYPIRHDARTVRPKDWTYDMLIARMTQELLAAQTEPSAFINARSALLRRSTPAVVLPPKNRPDGKPEPFTDGSQLSEAEDAMAALRRVHLLGADSAELTEKFVEVDWNGETRRLWMIGPHSVAGILMRYAKTVDVVADQETKEELKQSGLLKED